MSAVNPTAPGSQPNELKPQAPSLGITERLKTPWLGLRKDLMLHPGGVDPDGQEATILEDPVRGTNFKLGYVEATLLRHIGTAPTLEDGVRGFYRETAFRPSPEQVVGFVEMLQANQLTHLPAEQLVEEAAAPHKPGQQGFWQRVSHGYVYFRIPFLRPDAFLESALPAVRWLWMPWLRMLYFAIGMAGMMLTLPKIELYVNTASFLFTPQGAVYFGVSLVLLKIGHEFAHAFTAKSLGLHVRTMGVAFIVLWPILYTDTTESWKLSNRRHRLYIDSAGMGFELVIAGLALFAWAMLPDSILRSLMFFLSGTSLISSLFVNLNPFMRFDGYYVLMDVWGIDNLQPRAFALMKHKIRRVLFDWTTPAPEYNARSGWMIIYAFGASIYRLMVTLSIALAVYHLYFKALGLILLLLELWIFLLRPIWREMVFVFKNRKYMGSATRLAISGTLFLGLVALLVVPMPRVDTIPSLVFYEGTTEIKTGQPGELKNELPKLGSDIRKGDVIARLSDPVMDHEQLKLETELAKADARLETLGSGGRAGGYRNWLVEERDRAEAELEKIKEAQGQLTITSLVDGVVTKRNNDLYPGADVARDTWMVTVTPNGAPTIRAYVHEQTLERLPAGRGFKAEAHFPDLETPVLDLVLRERGRYPVHFLPNNALFDVLGGPIVSDTVGEKKDLVPREAYFAFVFDVFGSPDYLKHGQACEVWVEGEPQSVVGNLINALGRTLAEEGLM